MDEISISKVIKESFLKGFLDALEVDVAIAGTGKDNGNWIWEDRLEAGLLEKLWEIQDFLDGRA